MRNVFTAFFLAAAVTVLSFTTSPAEARFEDLCKTPPGLPSEVKSWLDGRFIELDRTLQDIKSAGRKFLRDCRGVPKGSTKDRECATRVGALNARKAEFNTQANHHCVAGARAAELVIQIRNLESRLEQHKTALGNMGFKSTVRQFHDWAQEWDEAAKKYDRAARFALISRFVTLAGLRLENLAKAGNEKLLRAMARKAEAIQKRGIDNPRVAGLAAFISKARTGIIKAEAGKKMLHDTWFGLRQVLRDPSNPMWENNLRTFMDLLGLFFVTSPQGVAALTLVYTGEFLFVSTTLTALRQTYMERNINALTNATEQQLVALRKISCLITNDAWALKEARAELAVIPVRYVPTAMEKRITCAVR